MDDVDGKREIEKIIGEWKTIRACARLLQPVAGRCVLKHCPRRIDSPGITATGFHQARDMLARAAANFENLVCLSELSPLFQLNHQRVGRPAVSLYWSAVRS